MDNGTQVYLGAWTNWSRGTVMGATLTLTREQGNLLIAFTALFIPFVASRFWRIFAIIFHQCYSTSDLRDAIHHQRQVMLRNSTSPESGLMSIARLMWAWRNKSPRAWSRILPLAIFAFLSICAFTVAGGFSSQISMAGEVLLRGDHCQTAYLMQSTDLAATNMFRSYTSTFTNNVANYAQQCYSNQSSGLLECARFVTGTIPTATMDYNASCPFKPEICRRDHSNIRFDTGHLNTNDIFGLNSPQDSTLTFRHVLQCAPLSTEGRTKNITVSDRNFTTYNYGPMAQVLGGQLYNYTDVVPDIATQYETQFLGLISNINLLLIPRDFGSFQGSFDKNASDFTPDPSIMTLDGDGSMYFLSGNGLFFLSPTEDDWYRATVPVGPLMRPNFYNGQRLYRPEEAASPLGCIQQYQFCRDPSQGQCGNLTGRLDSLYSAAPWFNLTSEDMDADRPTPKSRLGSLLIWAYLNLMDETTTLHGIITTLGSTSLASQNLVQAGLITAIQRNQWQVDVTRWWSILLAGFQATFVNSAQGTGLTNTGGPETEYDWEFCRNQKIRSAQHASFSIFGLAFTYAMGAIIIVLSFAIPHILCFLQKHGHYSKYAYLEWEGDTAIQLQRVAHDQLGHGHWSRCDDTIPITRPDDRLAPFDISDPKHPMLARVVIDIDDAVAAPEVEESKPENASIQDSSDAQTAQESSPEHEDEEVSPGSTGAGVRRALSDSHTQSMDSWSHDTADELRTYQYRPGTAP
ncbi:hypothetical protein PG995_004024 [Apiospora arundinis]